MQSSSVSGGDQTGRSGSRVILSTGASQASSSSAPSASSSVSNGQSVSSLAPPTPASQPPAYGTGGVVYGSSNGDLGYIGVVPHAVMPHTVMPGHADSDWAGPVLPGERVHVPKRLSTEERLRLRSDIRDASRNMYEHPRSR
ncbi:hypothetical protein FXN63_10670 [Pigmentiphaga aceris]|uniref:Uncharacterized protein n=1 Tax=Pigmentiphaga aceris TaxID=1940612 RepID=A0A5C0AZG6_9BURK|nr:hypothetical protein [Pigmentiphaga aceris]QEI06250.1 hypothetical protein FXN63_10670 [Pigmentiphaga aceris]